jgi:hypothetical protein
MPGAWGVIQHRDEFLLEHYKTVIQMTHECCGDSRDTSDTFWYR